MKLAIVRGLKTAKRKLLSLLIYLGSRGFGSVGEGLFFDPISSRIRGKRLIHIGNRVFIGARAQFSVHKRLTIEDDVLFGPEVMILSGNHPIENIGARINEFHVGIDAACSIGRDAWIGARSIIIGGVRIGEGTVVGAGSVITRDLPPYTVCAGAPCRVLRRRFTDAELRLHLHALGEGHRADYLIAARAAAFEHVAGALARGSASPGAGAGAGVL